MLSKYILLTTGIYRVTLLHECINLILVIIKFRTDENASCCQVPTSILYKQGQIHDQDSIFWGAEISEPTITEEDIYIKYIKQYIFNSACKDEEWNKAGLTIQKIVTDYLAKLHTALRNLEDKDTFKKGYFQDFKLGDSRYCLACPQSQQVFMGQCFIGAGIINEDELEYRLAFVTESEASAYNCLAWDRKSSRITVDEHYLVCDIGHTAFGISRIDAKSTESLSLVESVFEKNCNGSMNLENRFRSYLENNAVSLNMDQTKIGEAIKEFEENLKVD